MINATDLKNGTTFLHYGSPYQVIKYSLIKQGRGSAQVKVTAKNLENGTIEEISYQSNSSVEEARVYKKTLQYLYKDGDRCCFMTPDTFEQIEIPVKILGDSIYYLKEGEAVSVLFFDDRALSLVLPPKVIMKVTQTDPGVRGNSAINIYKPAILESGLKIKVPLFINAGDKIKVDTRTGQYVERAK